MKKGFKCIKIIFTVLLFLLITLSLVRHFTKPSFAIKG